MHLLLKMMKTLNHQTPLLSIMEASMITMLKDLDVNVFDFTIKVRIIRMWKLPSKHNANETYSIEMIIMDEQGTRMSASCLYKWFAELEQFFEQGACLKIKNSTLGSNFAKFKYVDSPHKICMFNKTKIEKCSDLFGSLYGFSFTSLKSIKDKSAPEDVSHDIIGSVVRYYDRVKKPANNGRMSIRRTMDLEDLDGNMIYVTLWDQFEHKFSEYIENNPNVTQVVLILQFGKLEWFAGKPYVSNTYGIPVSRVFLNDDIDEINLFKKSLLGKQQKETSSSSRRSSSSLLYSWRDEFLVNNDLTKVADVIDIQVIKSVVIVATVKSVDQNLEWYYDSCNRCTKKVSRNLIDGKNVFVCKSKDCDTQVITAVPRLRLNIRVQDSSGIISLTGFDRIATQLLKKTATDFLEKNLEGGYTRPLPDEFYDLVDKKFAMKLDVSEYNVNNKYHVFTILKITSDASIIEELQKRLDLNEPGDSASMNAISVDFPSQETDTLSYTADNETPRSDVTNRDGKRPRLNEKSDKFVNDKGLKRSLSDVYDVDEPSFSTTNTPSSSSQCVIEDGKSPLLIPKLEK